MTTRQTPDAVREAVARIVDPQEWDWYDYDVRHNIADPNDVSASLAKADDILAALDSRAGDAGEVVAWAFELATCIHSDGTYSGWDESPRLSLTKPCVPEGSIRNLRPLYSATLAPAVDAVPAGEVERS